MTTVRQDVNATSAPDLPDRANAEKYRKHPTQLDLPFYREADYPTVFDEIVNAGGN